MKICVIPTGTANLASVLCALGRLGSAPVVARSPADLNAADALVLPGVGHFAAGRRQLDDGGYSEPVRDWVRSGRPTLAICLGMQLLARASEEAPDVAGLDVLPVDASRLPASVSVPQLGWNEVSRGRQVRRGYAYFANSYRLTDAPDGWTAAWTDHGGPLIAALERDAQLLCQFHPELSGGWGHELLGRWLARASTAGREAAAC